ncbi:ATP-dependent RNA helicase DbpA [Enterobacter hormaechei]|uniref:ATP-dependent RNA helicase DbpA n=1 Tax=Enterobacter hormaechei TaxID=158836 RepID=UPI001E2AA26C|nr:ATP-dependent RNA helicase DbpA [Enterobacter hormaechei]MCC4569590.1 ATP-dependent RNA helicase DbpA [Enterobacter hormaechei subsp. hoffmannii]MCC4574301.1 ATP-dependent RNA helicase DbpA [Enterobacter hormaechei subsp. hoffmannii]MCC4578846.1 ATP-dependent RNA helicase DbpA [Enterobacter hormaechei subsp. hoffmannii]MCC4583226.1 ATP-dependent RNA helicase DbpA [Enterobacter hormaechei subsp. hoffmannii]MCE1615387.1 ATP-dependent RNA helicase DbpA [Enterobacter hormaechei]
MTAFSTLNVLPEAQLTNLNELGYLTMTPVQAAALPAILEGRDVRVQAKTGSGKTAAFGLGLLQHIDATLFQTQSLILCPTRELADQVAGELRRLARFLPNTKILTLCGGQPFGAQRDSLQHAPHIIVATPGRLLDHLQKGTVSLDALQTLVMDEADRMLDMGFSDAIDDVIRFAPATRQTLLFSATWPEAIAAISGRVQKNPLTIEIDTVDALPAIEQQFFETSQQGKIPLLQKLLSQHQPASCVVFCNTKKDCQAVCDALNDAGQSALSLHGDLEQRERDQTLVRFANGSTRVLVATDVAARGLDIKSLELVVNFELAWDPEVHIHRIGRTARAGNSGLAISFCAPEEAQRANILAEMLQLKLNWVNAPGNISIAPLAAEMATLCIDGGKKAKMRPGDVLGALTGDIGLDGADIGKITVHPAHVYVAVRQSVAHKAWKQLQGGKIKGKTCRVRLLK